MRELLKANGSLFVMFVGVEVSVVITMNLKSNVLYQTLNSFRLQLTFKEAFFGIFSCHVT